MRQTAFARQIFRAKKSAHTLFLKRYCHRRADLQGFPRMSLQPGVDLVYQNHRKTVIAHTEQLRMVVVALAGLVALPVVDLDLHARSNSSHRSGGERKPPESMDGELMPGWSAFLGRTFLTASISRVQAMADSCRAIA